jgi:hypothetical protein
MTNEVLIRGFMSPQESENWYQENPKKHYNPQTGKLACGMPGKSGRYEVRINGEDYWVFYSLLYSPSRAYKFSTNGQIVVRREYFEDQGIFLIASDTEPLYIKDHVLTLPSGYKQKVRVGYCKSEDLNVLRLKKKSDR